ncbi:hypothetical protein LINPERHAP1_LOCUS31284, partial [Linum perenne]
MDIAQVVDLVHSMPCHHLDGDTIIVNICWFLSTWSRLRLRSVPRHVNS